MADVSPRFQTALDRHGRRRVGEHVRGRDGVGECGAAVAQSRLRHSQREGAWDMGY
jgi:hypothetical protein